METVGEAFIEIKAATNSSFANDIKKLTTQVANSSTIELDVAVDDSKVKNIETKLTGLDGTVIDLDAVVDDEQLSEIESRISSIDGDGINTEVIVDDGEIDGAINKILDLDGDSVSVSVDADTSGLDGVGQDIEGQINSETGGIGDLGSSLGGKFGAAFKAGGLAVVAGFGAAFLAGLNQAFDAQAAEGRTAALLGLDDAQSARLGQIQGDLYKQAYGDSLEGLSDVSASAVRALGGELDSLSDEQISGLIVDLSNLESAFGVTAEQSGDAIRGILTNDLADSADEAADILTRSLQIDASGDIIDTFREYGTELKQLGVSGEEFLSFAEAGLDAGARNTDLIADALKESNIILQEGTEQSQAALVQLGLDSKQVQADISAGGESANDAFNSVLDALSGVDDEVLKNQLGVDLLGTKYEDLGPDVIDAMADASGAIEGLGEATEQLDQNINDNIGTSIETIKRTLIGGLGDALAPIAGEIANFLQGVDISGFAEGFQNLLGGVNFRQLLAPLQVIGDVIGEISGGVQAFAAAFADGADEITSSGLAGALEAIGVVARNLYDSFVSDLLPGLQETFGFIRDTVVPIVSDFVGNLVDSFLPTVRSIIDIMIELSVIILDFVNENQDTFAAVFEAVTVVIEILVGVISTAIDIILVLVEVALPPLKLALEVLGPVIGIVADVVLSVVTAVGTLVDAFNSASTFLVDAVNKIKSGVSSGFNEVVSLITGFASKFLSAGKSLGKGLVDGIAEGINAAGSFAKQIVNGVIDLINSQVIDRINDALEFTIPIPLADDITVNPPDIGHIAALADGGIVNQPTLSITGEAGPEVVVPLTRPQRALQLLQQSGLDQLLASNAGTAVALADGTIAASTTTNSNTITNNNNITVETQEGQDPVLLAESLLEEIASSDIGVGV